MIPSTDWNSYTKSSKSISFCELAMKNSVYVFSSSLRRLSKMTIHIFNISLSR